MALDDILLGENDNEEFVMEIPLDTLHSPVDILFETDSNNDIMIYEIPSRTNEIFAPFVF